MGANRIGVVMAGGSGERFWPLSRPDRPKQLLYLTNPDKTMLAEAVERILPLFGESVYVATSANLRAPVLESGLVEESRVFTEPVRRNTLGAQCWLVASLLARGYQDASVAILTADHQIGEPERFRSCVARAMDVAETRGGIVTIGVPPTRPETGYGYIEEADDEENGVRRSLSFREKPSLETADEFIAAGRFLWNSGMFFYTLRRFLQILQDTLPEAHEATMETALALGRNDGKAAVQAFEKLPNVSIDYAVMERTDDVFVVRADFPWDDVGAWDAMERTFTPDQSGNVIQGNACVLESRGCIVMNETEKGVIGAIGLRDLVVVKARDAVLVCPKDQAQRVRLIVEAIAKSKDSSR